MREGSLDAPTRHPVFWESEEFYNKKALDEETRRIFDICHGCRRCFNLCDSFPRLFDLIDESKTGELDSVDSADFKPVVDACTLCDMCFMAKCPYVPPHEFDLDFPHLMLRHRALQWRDKEIGFAEKQLIETDRNGKLGTALAPLANSATRREGKVLRPMLNRVLGVHQDAELPPFASKTLAAQMKNDAIKVNTDAPGFGRKAVLYATCYGSFNVPEIGLATRHVLAHNGVETELVYPECCGMPQFEKGDIAAVANKASNVATCLQAYIDKGYDVIALVPSCALMLKFEWPLLLPNDKTVAQLSTATYDVAEYIVELAAKGLSDGLQVMEKAVTVHIACHARAQNMGHKSAEMLRLVPKLKVNVIERCSGHGGSWGVMEDNFPVALKQAQPVARQVVKQEPDVVSSECPLAGLHIAQAMGDENPAEQLSHPVLLMARAYGFEF
ncbi:MAG: heterodisulfide reductase-related iron-sulfur binding cluster [Pseudomonadales bacterium]